MKISVGPETKLWKQKVTRGPWAPERSSRHSLPLGAGRGLRVGPLEGLQLSGRLSASFQQGLRADDKSGIPKASEKRGIVS